jgi:hypothetical protein
VCRDVVGDVGVHSPVRPAGPLHADHDGQRLVAHEHPLGGVLGEVAVTGDDHDDRLPYVLHLVLGQRVAGTRSVQRGVRDQQRQRLGDRGPFGLVGGDQVVVGVDRHQAVDVERSGRVDVDDACVGVRAAHEGDTQRARSDVVEEVRGPGDQPGVLDPLHPLAEQPGRHDVAPPSRVSSAARSTEATMFW